MPCGYSALREPVDCAPVCTNVTRQMATDIDDSYKLRMISGGITTSGIVGADRLKAWPSQAYEVVVNLLPDSSGCSVSDERDIVESRTSRYQWTSRPPGIPISPGFRWHWTGDLAESKASGDRRCCELIFGI